MKIVYSPRYCLDLRGHVWPIEKYQLTCLALLERNLIATCDLIEPAAASWEQLGLVHTPEYLQKIQTESLSIEEIAQLEIPLSTELVERFQATELARYRTPRRGW